MMRMNFGVLKMKSSKLISVEIEGSTQVVYDSIKCNCFCVVMCTPHFGIELRNRKFNPVFCAAVCTEIWCCYPILLSSINIKVLCARPRVRFVVVFPTYSRFRFIQFHLFINGVSQKKKMLKLTNVMKQSTNGPSKTQFKTGVCNILVATISMNRLTMPSIRNRRKATQNEIWNTF